MPTSYIASPIIEEIEKQKPTQSPALLSREEKHRHIQRAFHSLYRWYVDRSQTLRNWNPDRSFDWKALKHNHKPELISVIEGFYAVEQFVPDYTAEIVKMTRANYGRANFHLRWGSEEEKHSDLWYNMLLFSGQRTAKQIEDYTSELRKNTWTLPFDCPIQMLIYTVIQERATQLNYMNLAKVGRGENDSKMFEGVSDPIIAQGSKTIAADEAAHYNFFLEGARLYLYYFPAETLAALVAVIRNFMMPASKLIPNYEAFIKTLYEGEIFGRSMYAREVVPAALSNLGIDSVREVERGIKQTRCVPTTEGEMRETALFDTENFPFIDFSIVESAVIRLFDRIGSYEDEIGLTDINPTQFIRNIWGTATSALTPIAVR